MELPTDAPSATPEPATATWTAPPPTMTEAPSTVPTATVTPTQTETPTLTPTVTPSLTITPTPTYTPSATWTITPTFTPTEPPSALSGLVALALRATILPQPTMLPVQMPVVPPSLPDISPPVAMQPGCASPPVGGFGVVYVSDPTLAGLLGCPAGAETDVITAVQTFERGMMVYVSGQPGEIFALYNTGSFRRFGDTFVEGADPERSDEVAPPGLLTPIRGFLKVWRSQPDVRANLGWAVTEEAGNVSRLLRFDRGRMIYLPQRNQTVSLLETAGADSGTWRIAQGGG